MAELVGHPVVSLAQATIPISNLRLVGKRLNRPFLKRWLPVYKHAIYRIAGYSNEMFLSQQR